MKSAPTGKHKSVAAYPVGNQPAAGCPAPCSSTLLIDLRSTLSARASRRKLPSWRRRVMSTNTGANNSNRRRTRQAASCLRTPDFARTHSAKTDASAPAPPRPHRPSPDFDGLLLTGLPPFQSRCCREKRSATRTSSSSASNSNFFPAAVQFSSGRSGAVGNVLISLHNRISRRAPTSGQQLGSVPPTQSRPSRPPRFSLRGIRRCAAGSWATPSSAKQRSILKLHSAPDAQLPSLIPLLVARGRLP